MVTSWNGVAALKGTPPDIVKAVAESPTRSRCRMPRARAASLGGWARGSTSEDLKPRSKSDIAQWAE